MKEKTAILLSTYNGEKYLKEQLDSLINQTYQDFTLYIRDDGSSDATVSIITEYQKEFSKQIVIVDDNKGNIGVEKSFRTLVKTAKADYYFFCDQDDIWHLQKVEQLTGELNRMGKNSLKKALLTYSNFSLVNEKGKEIDRVKAFKGSFLIEKINKGAFRNLVPGCFMAFNEEAKKLYLSYENYNIHDELLFILTSVYGEISRVSTPLIQYRIHENNTIGIKNKKINWTFYLKDILKYSLNNKGYRNIVLDHYFTLAESIRKNNPLQKEFYTKEELGQLSWLSRKKWYYQHFFPLKVGGILKGGKEWLLI